MFKKPERSTGVSPPPLWLPKNAIPPDQVYVIIAISAGAVRGDRHCPLLDLSYIFISCPDERNSTEPQKNINEEEKKYFGG